MTFILNIDTASENASICLARDGESVVLMENAEQKQHASWIHPAIQQALRQSGVSLPHLQAIAVSGGPGSYTGLRVGMSTAKGLCYALGIPMITENTLRIIAFATRATDEYQSAGENTLFCPMIDARRMEVFTALFNLRLEEILPSTAIILDNQTFSGYLDKYKIIFTGTGSRKFQQSIANPNAAFADVRYSAIHLARLSFEKFTNKEFSNTAYTEPLYLKEFYTASKK